ncbi:hypothetical protein CKM354_001118200 [Cercospora kikuchii]|uniref:Uncharacterized protein n=1 Tax=Cercospora kikuchii TaxID=84275 RepID=A0A9P3CSI0_9PEZI|nr:uncharacterized protein CKM354_001118200 [Cercospora kikuchii]GIZ48109.1 hypothetical protein CKM354_001118200 [Cercospora kikuchii]
MSGTEHEVKDKYEPRVCCPCRGTSIGIDAWSTHFVNLRQHENPPRSPHETSWKIPTASSLSSTTSSPTTRKSPPRTRAISNGIVSRDQVVGVPNSDHSVTSFGIPSISQAGENADSVAAAIESDHEDISVQGKPEAKRTSRAEDEAAKDDSIHSQVDGPSAGQAHSGTHQSPPRPTAATGLRHVVNTVYSRRRSLDKEYFDHCLKVLEQEMLPLPTDIPVTADPRDYPYEYQWRDAVREELGLATKWWTDDGKGFILKLSNLRLRSEKDSLFCFDRSIPAHCCRLRDTLDFLEANPICDLEYCVDFFTKYDIELDDVNGFETREFSIEK